MNILGILCGKLDFIGNLYNTASGPFAAIQARIESGEEPFAYDGRPVEQPPYLEEWADAEESVNILGQLCLSLVQRSFKEFLVSFVKETGNELPRKGSAENWFEAYKSFFLREYGIDWEKSPVDVSFLEELNLARNDILHGGGKHDIYGMKRTQSKQYCDRFPQGLFVNEIHKRIRSGSEHVRPARIEITADKLTLVIQYVREFCSHISHQWQG